MAKLWASAGLYILHVNLTLTSHVSGCGPEHVLKLLVVPHVIQAMLIHQPTDTERIVWYGGNSAQLHYEVLKGNEWKEFDVRSFMEFPKSTKELKQEVVDYYNYISPEVKANYVEYDY